MKRPGHCQRPDLARVADLLRESLALWDVAGDVTLDCGVARVRAAADRLVTVERAPTDSPFRWFVRWRDPASSSHEPKNRPCGSLVGVLAALRRAFGVERGTAVRIAADAIEPELADSNAAASPMAPAATPPAATVAATASAHEAQCTPSSTNARVPINVLTGFLGSGKTTLLARLLRHPAMGRTAVLVNEFGEIGLDHDLIATSDESFVRLSTGCLCCKVRSDLVLTLTDLAARRRSGELPAFERIVIETSGLAEPAPILHALMTDSALAEAYALAGVVTTVDAITGMATLERHPQSVRQAAVADTIVLTKTDLPHTEAARLEPRLRQVNRSARILEVVRGDVSPALLLEEPGARSFPVFLPSADESLLRNGPTGHEHTAGIGTFSLLRAEPVHAVTLALFVSALADNCGEDLLRMKGIVAVRERPHQPAVIHGVQHVYHPPQWLERWPSADRRTRMVFIGYGNAQAWTGTLLELLDWEVSAELARQCDAAGAANPGG